MTPRADAGKRSRLRVVRGEPSAAKRRAAPSRTPPDTTATARRRRPRSGPPDVRDELLRLSPKRGEKAYERLMAAADAFGRDRERDAARILAPWAGELPRAAPIRELYGLALYRLGRWKDAARELEAYHRLTSSTDQHPVLMDCYRALGRPTDLEALWDELAATSPGPELVTEGRIVLAGSLADRGELDRAIAVLRKRAATKPARVGDHHLRLWYALGDLEERAGDLPAARAQFDRVRAQEPAFADVAERLAALR